MKSILFKSGIWAAKQKVLKEHGYFVTRRLIKLEPHPTNHEWRCPFPGDKVWTFSAGYGLSFELQSVVPPYFAGETLYVKEAWRTDRVFDKTPPSDIGKEALIDYQSTPDNVLACIMGRWRSPLHLPAKFARSFGKPRSVRPEKLDFDNLSHEELVLEGALISLDVTDYLLSINGKWVWRYEMENI